MLHNCPGGIKIALLEKLRGVQRRLFARNLDPGSYEPVRPGPDPAGRPGDGSEDPSDP